MSTLWTPDGERPIRREAEGPSSAYVPGGPAGGQPGPDADQGGGQPGPDATTAPGDDLPLSNDERAFLEQMAERQRQLAEAPGAAVVAQGAFLLVELAAVKLGAEPPRLDDARLAIDTLGATVEAAGDRLGEAGPELARWVADLRMRFVEVSRAAS